jgi:hypothetical protein
MSPLSEKATYSGPWRAFSAYPTAPAAASAWAASRLGRGKPLVVQTEATNPTMCDGDHMVLGGAQCMYENNGPIRAASPVPRHPDAARITRAHS